MRVAWERDLMPGLRCSLWINRGQYAYLYEHGKDRHVAKSAEEQADIHKLFGLPKVRGDFATGLRMMFLRRGRRKVEGVQK